MQRSKIVLFNLLNKIGFQDIGHLVYKNYFKKY
jgi:hypothetical protein